MIGNVPTWLVLTPHGCFHVCSPCVPTKANVAPVPSRSGDRAMRSTVDDKRIKATQDYFRLADRGRPEVLELFHEDAEIYFPKFGFGFGRQSLIEMTKGFAGSLEFIQHDYDTL